MLSREASAEPGKWHTSRAPYQRGIMDVCAEPLIETVVVMSSAQVGKTEIINNLIGYYMDQDPSPLLVLQPTLEMARAWSTDRLAPMLRDTPRLRGKIHEPRSRDSGNTILHKRFPGAHITIVGANSAAGLAMRPIRVVAADEVDRYPASAGTEGDPVSLAVKRTATFWNRKVILMSTPTVKGASRIHDAWEQSDQRRYHVPCPSCGHPQPLTWKQLKWASGKPESPRYECIGCEKLIEEIYKPRMLERGAWVSENRGARAAGFHLNALYSPWTRWEELVREFLEAKGNPERLKVFVNTVLGETWEEQGEQIDPTGLEARREAYSAEVPVGVGVLTGGVDVQGDRVELEVRGWGAGEESWLIAHHRVYGDPERQEVWQRLEALVTKPYRHEHGASLRIRACAIDSGAFTHAVYRFVRPRQQRGVHATKGSSERGRPLIGKPSRVNRHGVRVWPIGTDTAKDALFLRLRIQAPGPGYLHFPLAQEDGADGEYLAQFGAEKVVTRFKKGVRIRDYQLVRDRNEAIDLYCLSLAALHALGRGVTEQLGRWVAHVDASGKKEEPVEGEEATPTEPTEAPKGRRRSNRWVNRWR